MENLTSKDQLVNNIKEWIKMDNELSKMRAEMKKMNAKKKMLTESLVNVMKLSKIDNFDLNGGGELVFKSNKIKKPLNGKTLLNALQNYYKTDEALAKEIAEHVMNSREELIKETIRMKTAK